MENRPVRIEQWCVIDPQKGGENSDKFAIFDDKSPTRLSGIVHDHPTMPNEEIVVTSPLITCDLAARTATTLSGRSYTLGEMREAYKLFLESQSRVRNEIPALSETFQESLDRSMEAPPADQ